MRLLAAMVLVLSVSAFADSVYVLTPEADAGVSWASPDSNTGDSAGIIVKNVGGGQKGYFRFNLSTVTGTITYAKFKIRYVTADSGMILNVKVVASDSWNEDSITFNNAPMPVAGAALATMTISAPAWAQENGEFLVTSAAVTAQEPADQKLSLIVYMTGSGTPSWTEIFSKERAVPDAFKPSLTCSTTTSSGIFSRSTRVSPASGFTMRTIADGIDFLLGAQNSDLEIYDMQGRLVRAWPAANSAVRWNAKGTAAGRYIAVLRNKDALVTEPIRISH